MSQDHVGRSGLRTLTLEEVNAVSGGFAVIPLLINVAKVAVILILDAISNNDSKKDNQSPHEPNP